MARKCFSPRALTPITTSTHRRLSSPRRPLRIKSYRSFKVDETTPPEALERLRRLETFDVLRWEGCSEAVAPRAVGWSRATHCRSKARHRDGGLPGLTAKSRRPHRVRARSWTREDE